MHLLNFVFAVSKFSSLSLKPKDYGSHELRVDAYLKVMFTSFEFCGYLLLLINIGLCEKPHDFFLSVCVLGGGGGGGVPILVELRGTELP